jgi:hypothetical protein
MADRNIKTDKVKKKKKAETLILSLRHQSPCCPSRRS